MDGRLIQFLAIEMRCNGSPLWKCKTPNSEIVRRNARWAGNNPGSGERTSLRAQVVGRSTRIRESGAAADCGERRTQRAGEGASVPRPLSPETLRRLPPRIADHIIRAVSRLLQRALGEMRVALRHARVRMPQDLLDLIEGPPAVHEEGGILVPQIVDAQMR